MTIRNLAIFAIAIAVASCSKSSIEGGEMSQTMALSLYPTMQTKATELDFTSGDAIGVTIIDEEGTTRIDNVKMTYNGVTFEGDDLYWNDSYGKSTIKAYYPYDKDGVPTSYTLDSDQNSYTKYYSNLILSSITEDVTPSESSVTISFSHLLAKVTINITDNTEYELLSYQMWFSSSYLDADFDTSTYSLVANNKGVKSHITTFLLDGDGANYQSYMLMIPQQLEGFSIVVESLAGERVYTSTSTKTVEAGKSYTLDFALNGGDDLELL